MQVIGCVNTFWEVGVLRRKITIQALVAVLVLLLMVTAGVVAGCSSNSSSGTNNNPYGGGGTGGGGTGGGTGGGGVQSGTASVIMQNIAFNPSSLTVTVGTTVTWTNDDSTSHTVTFTDIAGVDSGTMSRGQTFSYTFNTAGTFHYYCKIHGASAMSGTVTVQ